MIGQTENINIDDAVLVEQCRRGDSAALEQLLLKYQQRLYNVILKICANTHDAAELTQDTFVKVIEKLDTFEGRSGFYTWAFRIAVNLALNYCQRNAGSGLSRLDEQRDEQKGGTGQVMREFLSDNNSPDPAEVAANKELCRLAVKSLMKLDDAQRAVLVLRDIEGMNYAQIAKVLDVELGTVKSRLSRARSNLRQLLETVL
jgi:RNA polymerase sigma-70 factor (ECF subfamily)